MLNLLHFYIAKMGISNKWRNKISIKNQFEDDTTPELIIKLTGSLITQLTKIKDREEISNLTDYSKECVLEELELSIDNFEFLGKLADGTIPKDKWKNYSFNGDFEEIFNDYLEELYDLGDNRVTTNNNITEKFLWIG